MKAGTKHAVYRHFDTKEGWFLADEVNNVHNILLSGERTEKKGKIEYSYIDKNNGVEYTVAAEKQGRKEKFVSFYTNRKAPNSGMQNTQLSAQTSLSDAYDAANVDKSSEATKSSDEGLLFRTSNELNDEYGDRWLTEQTNNDGRHSTQVKNTVNSYKKFGTWVKEDAKGRDVSILDASSGLGLGTEALRNEGFAIDDVEPYPSSERPAPTFTNYADINKKYDYVISNAVLNVIPSDWRANVLHDMADKLKVGGKMVINVRGAESIRKQGKEGVTRITLDDPSEILVLRPDGSIKAYQKGFTKQELKDWCEKELGEGYSVEIATKKNAGDSYDTAVVVTKNNGSDTIGAVLFREMGEEELSQRVQRYDAENNSELGRFVDYIKRGRVLSNGESNHFKVGEAGEILERYGILGNIFTNTSTIAERRHTRNADHGLTPSEWVETMEVINDPLAITVYRDRADSFRIYTTAIKNGKSICLGVDVKRNGQGIEIDGIPELTDIITAFGRNIESAINHERILYPEGPNAAEQIRQKFAQSSEAHNSQLYKQTSVSAAKVENESDTTQLNDVKDSTEAKTAAINSLYKEMNLQDDITVLTSTEGLTGKRATAQGWYDPRTGRITIVLPNNADAADVKKTFFHEAVGHYGLRKLVGEDNYNDFLDHVYSNAEKGIAQDIDKLAEEKYKGNRRTATEEYMSTLAEDGTFLEAKNRSLFQKIKHFFTDLLRKAGINISTELSDNDLRYMLWRSYQHLQRGGKQGSILDRARDIVTQQHLGVLNFGKRPQTVEQREINKADKNRGLLFRASAAPNNDPHQIASQYYNERSAIKGHFFNHLSEAYLDNLRSVRVLQEGMEKALGRKLSADERVWEGLIALQSVNQKEIEHLQSSIVQPLSETIGTLIKKHNDVFKKTEDVEKYMYCKHGLERNEVMRNNNIDEAMERDTKALAEKLYNESVKNGDFYNLTESFKRQGLAQDDAEQHAEQQLRTIAETDAKKMVNNDRGKYEVRFTHDYSGITELLADDLQAAGISRPTFKDVSNMAATVVNKAEAAMGSTDTHGLWNDVKRLTDFALLKSYNTGVISLKQLQDTRKQYTFYIPLRGWANDRAEDTLDYILSGSGLTKEDFQTVMKKAYGRKSQAAFILGTMFNMATTAITQGNKNAVRQRYLNLAERAMNPLLSVGEVFYEKSPNGTLTPYLPDFSNCKTEADRAAAVAQWRADAEAKFKAGQLVRGKGRLTLNGLHATKSEEMQHQVIVHRGGKDYMVFLNGNPRAAQAINGDINFMGDKMSAVEKFGKDILRLYANVQTSLNPEFVVSNFERDAATAAMSAFMKEGAGYAAEYGKNLARIMPLSAALDRKSAVGKGTGIYGLIYKEKKGTLDMSDETERYYYEFVNNGAPTGLVNYLRLEDYQRQLEKLTRYGTEPNKQKVQDLIKFMTRDMIEYANMGIENATRFATYMTSRQAGKSIVESVQDAKECSVNFQVHGSGEWGNAMFRGLYNYANAGFQSIRMLTTWAKAAPIKFTATGVGVVVSAMLMAMLGDWLGQTDDEDNNGYYGLSEWNRYKYVNLGLGHHWFHIPLAQEYRPLWSIGNIFYDWGTGRISNEHAMQGVIASMEDYAVVYPYNEDMFSYKGEFGIPSMLLYNAVPTQVKDWTDAYIWNRDFMGRKIHNATQNNGYLPEWQRAGRDTPQFMIEASKWANENLGGGHRNRRGWIENNTGITFNPSILWHGLSGYGGGLLTFGMKTYNLGDNIFFGGEHEAKDLPFVGKFYVYSGDDKSKQRNLNDEYRNIEAEFQSIDREYRRNFKDRDMSKEERQERISEMKQDGEVELWDSIVGNVNAIKHMQKAVSTIEETNPEQAEVLRAKILENKRKVVEKVRQIRSRREQQ